MEVSICCEDVEFLAGFLFVVTAEWPGAGALRGVFSGKVYATQSDSQIEVAEDELDTVCLLVSTGFNVSTWMQYVRWQEERGKWDRQYLWDWLL
jgi:hypothetical protein